MAVVYLRTALLRDIAPLSLAGASSVTGFSVEGSEPAGTARRLVFSHSDINAAPEYFKLAIDENGTATEVAVTTQEITADSVLTEGNTAAELLTVKDIPAWVGTTVYPVIALSAPEEQTAVPALKLGIITNSIAAQYEKYEESPVYVLADSNVDIVSANGDNCTVTGNATVDVEIRLRDGGTWGEYMNIKNAAGLKANAVQLRARYRTTTLDGSESAKLDFASVVYSSSAAKLSGETTELVLNTKHFKDNGGDGIVFATGLIRHTALRDAKISGYVALRDEIQTREMYAIGTGTGARQTIDLPDENIDYNSVVVYVNGNAITDYSVNTTSNQISLTADRGMAITASYTYGWEDETWREMACAGSQVYNGSDDYMTLFQYGVPEEDTGKTVSTVKFKLDRPEGDVADELLGIANGDTQIFLLPHFARADTITCSGVWNYNEATRILTVQHTRGQEIRISYHWTAESHEVKAVAAGWAVTSG